MGVLNMATSTAATATVTATVTVTAAEIGGGLITATADVAAAGKLATL